MSNINATMVKELREKTGAGIMDCKGALEESDGDIAKAEAILNKKGLASAAKKAGRSTSEGLVVSYIHTGGRVGSMIELNCETANAATNNNKTCQFVEGTQRSGAHRILRLERCAYCRFHAIR